MAAFAHALRAEVAHQGVAVGIAYPSWTDTDMIRDAERHTALRELRLHMPLSCAPSAAPCPALHQADTALTATGGFIGTIEYITPEQARGAEGHTANDLFSLDVTL